MPTDHRDRLARIRRFDQLVAYLRDELGWPIESEDFEELTFEYTPEELGIDNRNAAKIQDIKRLRPLSPAQPWGIFFVKFEPKRLPVVALRRILSQVALKKRASANRSERQAWVADDLLFVSNYGEGEERRIAFAHFAKPRDGHDLPTLKVLGWDNLDTPLHLDAVARELTSHLAWPDDEDNTDAWRERWRAAFTLRHREVITTSKQLSERLAELARAIRDRITTALAIETETGPLTKLLKAFQTALVHDLNENGFADMYAQTIAYGLLSARITDPEKRTADDLAAHMRTNPFLRELMETFLRVGGRRSGMGGSGIDFDELGISEVIELLDQANMEAVVRDFGDRNPQEDPVIHFYEHFLAAYDKKQKVSRGVFYTPRPVVSYIVRSVDELLRSEFGLADGLADTTSWGEMAKRHKDLKIPEGTPPEQAFVNILDPATGTGTFLVEVIELIHSTLIKKWKNEDHNENKINKLWNEYVPEHLLPRLHGYELLMAPYAIAHLKIGLKLYETGYHFESEERARVYLTNALEPPANEQFTLDFLPALAHEAQAVNEIKQKQRFTAVIGNPPYSNFGQLNKIPFIRHLLQDYKRDLKEKKINLDDDFIKFIRFAQYTIDVAQAGILGMITNNVYLDGITHRRMRKSLLDSFSSLQFVDLHGNISAHETTETGGPDENVFDIKQGVAISLLNRGMHKTSPETVRLCDLLGTREKKYQLLAKDLDPKSFKIVRVVPPSFFFNSSRTAESSEYFSWPSLDDIANVIAYGIQTKQDSLFVGFTRVEVADRLRQVISDFKQLGVELAAEKHNLRTSSGWSPQKLSTVSFDENCIQPILYRPFDQRFVYYDSRVLGRARLNTMRHMLSPNLGLIVMRQVFQNIAEYSHVGVTKVLIDERTFYSNRGGTYLIPMRTHDNATMVSTQIPIDHSSSNFKSTFMGHDVQSAGLLSGDNEQYLLYVVAVLYSRGYRRRYLNQLKGAFPRIPSPPNNNLGETLCALGKELVEINLLESSKLNKAISTFSGPTSTVVTRVGWSNGTVWLDAGRTAAREAHRATKPGSVGFQGVPKEVWDFHIGGYQVCHKWLKDRKGRTLSDEEIAHYQYPSGEPM